MSVGIWTISFVLLESSAGADKDAVSYFNFKRLVIIKCV